MNPNNQLHHRCQELRRYLGYPDDLGYLECPEFLVRLGYLEFLGYPVRLAYPVHLEFLGYLGYLEYPVHLGFLGLLEDPEFLEFLGYLEYPGCLGDPVRLEYLGRLVLLKVEMLHRGWDVYFHRPLRYRYMMNRHEKLHHSDNRFRTWFRSMHLSR